MLGLSTGMQGSTMPHTGTGNAPNAHAWAVAAWRTHCPMARPLRGQLCISAEGIEHDMEHSALRMCNGGGHPQFPVWIKGRLPGASGRERQGAVQC